MPTEQAIQDVAMIARNGIDRVIELERENNRLTEALLKANAQAEHFEREWYLRGDEIERLRELSDEMFSPEFKFNESGFLVAGEHEAPFTCKYCGLPSWIDPSDQSPPPDYCHEIDHGTAEDRAVFGSRSVEP